MRSTARFVRVLIAGTKHGHVGRKARRLGALGLSHLEKRELLSGTAVSQVGPWADSPPRR